MNDSTRLATLDDVAVLARSLAEAFADDPLMSYILPNDATRRRRSAALFSVVLRHQHLPHGATYTDEDRRGAALWAPPGMWKMTSGQMARGAPGSMWALRTAARRSVRVLNTMERQHPHEPHWYLAIIGTDPRYQGQGIGTSLMAPVLRRCDEDGIGAYLESSNEKNVPYYRRQGFEVTSEIGFPDGPTIWPMWRDPRPPPQP
jgi:ribosomal protein S18 acetylase RimI-like enzyme